MSMKVRFRLEECLCGGVTVDIEDTIWHFAKRESADRFLISRGFEQAGWRAGEDEVTDLERLVKADFEANPPHAPNAKYQKHNEKLPSQHTDGTPTFRKKNKK